MREATCSNLDQDTNNLVTSQAYGCFPQPHQKNAEIISKRHRLLLSEYLDFIFHQPYSHLLLVILNRAP